jgi:macrolide-specific efflux system membrane fusion protein
LQKLELTIQNQLDIKNKDLEIARLKLQSLMNQLEKSRLYAQMDGQVVHIANVGEGNSIDAYTTVVTLADVNELEIEYVGREAGNFRNGMKVELTVKKETFSGEVIKVPADVPFEEYERYRETVRFRVVGRMPEGVKPGDNVTIKLTLEQKLNTLTVPRSAVRMYMGNKLVYVLEDGLRIEKQVETGIEQGNMTEILEGLEEGELVIIN